MTTVYDQIRENHAMRAKQIWDFLLVCETELNRYNEKYLPIHQEIENRRKVSMFLPSAEWARMTGSARALHIENASRAKDELKRLTSISMPEIVIPAVPEDIAGLISRYSSHVDTCKQAVEVLTSFREILASMTKSAMAVVEETVNGTESPKNIVFKNGFVLLLRLSGFHVCAKSNLEKHRGSTMVWTTYTLTVEM
jgi:hypothetical protein